MVNVTCLLSAACFFVGNLIKIFSDRKFLADYDEQKQAQLDTEYLQELWGHRRDNRAKYFSAGIINGFAWLFFAFPMLQLVWILSHRGKNTMGAHIFIGVLTIAGGVTEFIARFMYIGATIAAEYVAGQFNMDNWVGTNSNDGIGWSTLEITHVVTIGFVYFLDTVEWLIIFLTLSLTFFSVRSYQASMGDGNVFGGFWAGLGLFVALLSLLDFIGQILNNQGIPFTGQVSYFYTAANRLVLLPIWLILLSCSLPRASMKLDTLQESQRQQQAEITMAGGGRGNGAMPPPTFPVNDPLHQ